MRPLVNKNKNVKSGIQPDRLSPSTVHQAMSSLYALWDLEHAANEPDGGWGVSGDPFPAPRDSSSNRKVNQEIKKAVKNVTKQLTTLLRAFGPEKQVGGVGKSGAFTEARAKIYQESIMNDTNLRMAEAGAPLSLKCLNATREHFDSTFGAFVGCRGDNSRMLTFSGAYHELFQFHSGLGPGKPLF